MKNNCFKNKKYYIGLCIVFIGMVLLFGAYWIAPHTIEELLFHLGVSAEGTNYQALLLGVGIGLPICTILSLVVWLITNERVFRKKVIYTNKKNNKQYIVFPCLWLKKRILKFSVLFLVLSGMVFLVCAEIPVYAYYQLTYSDVFEKYYVETSLDNVTFNGEKKNLVYIVLESMETDFADEQSGGEFEKSRIPNLTRMANENISFSNSETLGGADTAPYCEWSTASLVAQTSGIPCKTSYTGENDDEFLKNVVTLGDILNNNGYYQCLMMGFDSRFAAVDLYCNTHKMDEIYDYNSAKKDGTIDEDYKEFWGFEDEKLFNAAKNKISALSQKDQPFALTLITMDTHFFGGYKCKDCKEDFFDSYSNALCCSDNRVSAFIEWLKEQPFYEDTVIVLSGDHPTMDPWFLPIGSASDGRPIYNCIINSQKTAQNCKNRNFTVMDMFPTVLSAMGADIKGNRLGLGTDLFSSTPTLSETLGVDEYYSQLLKRSEYYDKKISGKY